MENDLFQDKDAWKKYTTKDLKKILPNYFEFTGDIERSAYLNWRFDAFTNTENRFYQLGIAYFQTSIKLIDECLIDNNDNKADIWIFPILFNVVHGSEVFLKGFNSQMEILNKLEKLEYQESKIEGNHNIKQLCDISLSIIKKSSHNEMISEFNFIKKFIEILYDKTNDMTFARYPLDTKNNAHFYADKTSNVVIDLDVLRIWVSKVFSILQICTSYVDGQIEEIVNYLYEAKQDSM